MRKLYAHPNLAHCDLLRAALEMRGIACEMRNEFASHTAAAGVGALPFAWPELWVNEDQYEEAQRALRLESGAEDAGSIA
jgi:hypothetical protein